MCKDFTSHFTTNGDILHYIKRIQKFHYISYSCDECGNIFSLEVDLKTKKRHLDMKLFQNTFHTAMPPKGDPRIHTNKIPYS